MTSDPTPDPVPVPPEDEPPQIFPSATGVVVPEEGGESAGSDQSATSDT